MIVRMIALSVAAALTLTGCAGSDSGLQRLATSAPTPYQLGPGDQMRISVYGLDMMNDTYQVSDTGTISLPMVGSVPVSGKSVDTAP